MPLSINRALNYNEQKVQKGKAACIGEANMLLPASCMNFYQKLEAFQDYNKRNERAQTKTIHISLNFDPSENHSPRKLNLIASAYMDRIGFGEQPYLVYQHLDAGHPHIHIVSTTIRADGSRINTHNIGHEKSEPARKELEEIFALVPASRQEKIEAYLLRPIEIEKAEYGYSETRRSIANIVSQVIDDYNFTSLPLFNAILGQYNVIADEGKENGIIRRNKGLQYRLLDKQGNKIGVPIKASSLPGQPTLQKLATVFVKKQAKRDAFKDDLKSLIDQQLQRKPYKLEQLIQILAEQKVQTVLRTSPEGRVYGITFVDQQNRSAFNGSELGKSYSIAGLQKQFTKTGKNDQAIGKYAHLDLMEEKHKSNLLDELLRPEKELEQTPYHLRKKKKPDSDH